MRRVPIFWGIHAEPGPKFNWFLAAIPFILIISLYVYTSYEKRLENPDYKLMPSIFKMVETTHHMAFEQDKRSGKYLMLTDTLVSLKRLLIGVSIASTLGLIIGINMGLFPGMKAILIPLVTFVSIVPPLAILPILFVFFGIEEMLKVMLILIGVCPTIIRDIFLAAQKISKEHITKAETLGASELQIVYSIVLPQILPRLIETTRLSLGSAWLFLIASESVASTDGLGFRIYLVMRYFSMDTIIPYVLWITFLGFATDWILRKSILWKYPWYFVARDS